MQWLGCVFGDDTGLEFREVASKGAAQPFIIVYVRFVCPLAGYNATGYNASRAGQAGGTKWRPMMVQRGPHSRGGGGGGIPVVCVHDVVKRLQMRHHS
jgi:hypothetical protein